MNAPIKYVCDFCGADDTAHTEGFLDWDVPSQNWVFSGHTDAPLWCACGGDNCFTETPVTDVKTLAQIAIKQEEANEARA